MKTKYDTEIPDKAFVDYFKQLKNRIYKCLPMYEEKVVTLPTYLDSLLFELCGGSMIADGDLYIELINKMAYINRLDSHGAYRKQVLDCLNICDKIIAKLEEVS